MVPRCRRASAITAPPAERVLVLDAEVEEVLEDRLRIAPDM